MATLNQVGGVPQVAPPDLPAMTGVSGTLVNYLKTLNIWLTQQFKSQVTTQAAVSQIMLLSPGGITYALRAQDNGNISIVRVTPGSKPA